jgi:hypothetical protein
VGNGVQVSEETVEAKIHRTRELNRCEERCRSGAEIDDPRAPSGTSHPDLDGPCIQAGIAGQHGAVNREFPRGVFVVNEVRTGG